MTTEKEKNNAPAAPYQHPEGCRAKSRLTLPDNAVLDYEAVSDWIVLKKDDKPAAEMFYTAYLAGDDASQRPLTFVFNGGPGAASAYLHMGALGPRAVRFNDDGTVPGPPVTIDENPDTWLTFTDLVFIDPVGTGFSRTVPGDQPAGKEKKTRKKNAYWKLKRDLESLGEFMQKFLSLYHRWESPCFIAGESYGGFRVARLAKLLQQGYGIGLNGVVIISPALEFVSLDPSDYDLLNWLDTFPSMAAAAACHGRSGKFGNADDPATVAAEAQKFAALTLAPALIQGDQYPGRETVFEEMAAFLGLEPDLVVRHRGRIPVDVFVRELLRHERKVCGRYDASVTAVDPFPDRAGFEGPDPTLYGIERLFAAGINAHLRKHIGLETDRDYILLSMEVHESWEVDIREHALQSQVGATDDLRYGMSINPDMKVFISHGYYDLITPFRSSDRLVHNMKLTDFQKTHLRIRHFPGGHMFYSRPGSRRDLASEMQAFYDGAVGE